MSSCSILPYYHPTSVVIVDDNDLFLHTLDLRLPGDLAYVLHHDARAALERINRHMSKSSITERCFFSTADRTSWREPVIQLDLGSIEQEIANTERFDRVSVVIVDYAMPAMNGLEFCRAIQDKSIKKILLTGVADEKLAVKAFNEGLIDRFLPKSGDSTLEQIVSFTRDLQRAYFFDQQRAFRDSLSASTPQFFADPAVSVLFNAICDRHGIVEHYLVGDPPGYVLVSASGRMFRLVILGAAGQKAQVEFAEQFGAPKEVVYTLRAGSAIGYFFDEPEGVGESGLEWPDYLHPATVIQGTQSWLTTLIVDPPIDIDFDPVSSSYDLHLDQLDRLAFTALTGNFEAKPPPEPREHRAH